jgi:putative ABC transport system permease protein
MAGTTLADRLALGLDMTAAQHPLGPRPEGWSENGWRREGPYDTVTITPLGKSLGRQSRAMFLAVFAAVTLLALIAAANVSSLMTSRVLERRRELDMRRALGAGAGDIARLWSLEALLLIVAGGVLGALAAAPALQLILALLPKEVALLKPARLDWRVAGFVAIAMVILAALVAVVPIYRSLRAPAGAAKAGGSDRVRTRGRFMAISGQVAAAFVLTVVGACLVGSLLAVYATDRPIRMDDVVVVEGTLRGPGYVMGTSPERQPRGEVIVDRLKQASGVADATLIAAQLLSGGGWGEPFRTMDGRLLFKDDADMWAVMPGFYDLIGLAPIEGRVHTDAELRSNAPLVVVSRRIAQAYWPTASAIGQTLIHAPRLAGSAYRNQPFTVIGVVPDVPWFAWDRESAMYYVPYGVGQSPHLTFLIRTRGQVGPAMNESIRAIAQADPKVRLRKAAPLATLFRDTVSLRRFQSWLFGGFAAAALAVVGVGILGLLAMSAARRTKEIGIRCALGATPRLVTRQLVREQLMPVLAGLAIGGAVAAWAVGFVQSYVYKLSVTDPRIWSAAIALILATALLGALLPARRASRIDPVKALRTE